MAEGFSINFIKILLDFHFLERHLNVMRKSGPNVKNKSKLQAYIAFSGETSRCRTILMSLPIYPVWFRNKGIIKFIFAILVSWNIRCTLRSKTHCFMWGTGESPKFVCQSKLKIRFGVENIAPYSSVGRGGERRNVPLEIGKIVLENWWYIPEVYTFGEELEIQEIFGKKLWKFSILHRDFDQKPLNFHENATGFLHFWSKCAKHCMPVA